jgi:predicted O-methyltransferase YrrM
MTIRSRLFRGRDPYADFDATRFAADTQGWGSQHPVFEAVLKRARPRLIIEVGSWKGASAIQMAGLCKKFDHPAEIVCVDTWLGSPQLYTRPDDQWYASLAHINGYPSMYYTFLANVVRADHADVITPFPQSSQHAAAVLTAFGAKADVIYIDAGHDYASVRADIESYWPLLTDDGVLIGDDYRQWPGVTRAANEFAGKVGNPIYATTGKFVIPRKADAQPISVTFS